MNISLIPISGSGNRLLKIIKMKKQFFLLDKKNEMFIITLNNFVNNPLFDKSVLIIDKDDEIKVQKILSKHNLSSKVELTYGGKSREESVYNGLKYIDSKYHKENPKVFIHDGDRPFISSELIYELNEKALKGTITIPGIKVKESIYDIKEGKYINRENLVRVQTPQVAYLNDFIFAFNSATNLNLFTDEGGIFKNASLKVKIINRDEKNIKISTSQDLESGIKYINEK